jgi:hypothetical protein
MLPDALSRLAAGLNDSLSYSTKVKQDEIVEHVRTVVGRIDEAGDEIVCSVIAGEPAPRVHLNELHTGWENGWIALTTPWMKPLYRIREALQVAMGLGGGLALAPELVERQLVENVDDAYESYRIHACKHCGSRWLEDHNPDSDPSVTRWWPR